MRLIDADALYDRVEESRRDNTHRDPKVMVNHINEHGHFLDMIIEAPTIDAEPVQHGRWIDMQEDDATEGMWRCSACGSDRYFDIFTPGEAGCYYCPNCGAKMHAEEVIDR